MKFQTLRICTRWWWGVNQSLTWTNKEIIWFCLHFYWLPNIWMTLTRSVPFLISKFCNFILNKQTISFLLLLGFRKNQLVNSTDIFVWRIRPFFFDVIVVYLNVSTTKIRDLRQCGCGTVQMSFCIHIKFYIHWSTVQHLPHTIIISSSNLFSLLQFNSQHNEAIYC